jgi:uncharacterized protein (TIGR01777 family)
MRIVLAGGTGFLGRALAASLAADSHEILILTRRAGSPRPNGARFVQWTPDGSAGPFARAIDGADVVVNLAGESIAGRRWSPAQKKRILESRINATRSLATAITRADNPPPVFISGSAVGYYGPRGDEIVTEDTAPGSDFLAGVAVQWEAEALRAASDRTRVACIRTGIVLERDGGALAEMLLPFKLFVGGPVGSGRQYWPWIHREDWVGLVRWTISRPDGSGPINATAPNPVTNADFARALGRALHRPAFMPAPAFALRLLLGEMADPLLLTGQRVVPAKALTQGYQFRYARVDDALEAIVDRR